MAGQDSDWIKNNIDGSAGLIDWFGHWPAFHDAEVTEICLSRDNDSWVKVHTWKTTGEVDANGHFVTEKDVIVTFWIEGI